MRLLIFILCFPLVIISMIANAQENGKSLRRTPTTDEIMRAIADFEKIMNKNIPSMEDFYSLYRGEGPSEIEMYDQERYCKEILKLEPDTIECNKGLEKLANGIKPRPSIYLSNVKNLITDSRNLPVKFYASPNIKYCQNGRGSIFVESIALVNGSKIKFVQFAFGCTAQSMEAFRLEIAKINGKNPDDYPLTVTKPFRK